MQHRLPRTLLGRRETLLGCYPTLQGKQVNLFAIRRKVSQEKQTTKKPTGTRNLMDFSERSESCLIAQPLFSGFGAECDNLGEEESRSFSQPRRANPDSAHPVLRAAAATRSLLLFHLAAQPCLMHKRLATVRRRKPLCDSTLWWLTHHVKS